MTAQQPFEYYLKHLPLIDFTKWPQDLNSQAFLRKLIPNLVKKI